MADDTIVNVYVPDNEEPAPLTNQQMKNKALISFIFGLVTCFVILPLVAANDVFNITMTLGTAGLWLFLALLPWLVVDIVICTAGIVLSAIGISFACKAKGVTGGPSPVFRIIGLVFSILGLVGSILFIFPL